MKKRIKFFVFLGASLFFYRIEFFPSKGEHIELNQILFDVSRSALVGFLVVYVSDWINIYFTKKKKSKKE